MTRAAILVAFCVACGGAVDDAPETDETSVQDVVVDEQPETPLCPGAREPGPDDCQTLVYNLVTGYCNVWEACP
jgi:hypothetical protein